MKDLGLHLVATSNDYCNNAVSGVSRCFSYVKRFVPSTLADVVGDDATLKRVRKRAKLAAVELSAADRLAKDNYWSLFCPHKVKPVNSLLPRQTAHLVAVTDISRYCDVAFTGLACSVVVTWTDDGGESNTVYRTCGRITLSARDIVNPQLGLLFNTSSILSGLQTFLVEIHIVSVLLRRRNIYRVHQRSIKAQYCFYWHTYLCQCRCVCL